MIQSQENGGKPHFRPDLGPVGPNSGHHFFSKNLASSVNRGHGQLSSCKISGKTNDQILRNLLTGRQTDRQTDAKKKDEEATM